MQGIRRAETVRCNTGKRNCRTRERNASITNKALREPITGNCTGHLDERKLPRGIPRLFTSSQLMLHASSQSPRIPRRNDPTLVGLEDPAAKGSTAFRRIRRATDILKQLLQGYPPATTQPNGRRKEAKACRVNQTLLGLPFPILTHLGFSIKCSVTPKKVSKSISLREYQYGVKKHKES